MTRPVFMAAIAGLAFSVFAFAPASARGFDEPASQRVSYADLNINSEEGARVLVRRIRQAAEEVCGADTTVRLLRARREMRACIRETSTRAVAQVDNPTLTAVYEGRRLTLYASR